jgi:hypothetical protein
VLTYNLQTTSQRAMVAAGLANMRHGGDRKSDQAEILPLDHNALISQERAAGILNVSDRTIRHAVVVRATDDADLIHAMSGRRTELLSNISLWRARKSGAVCSRDNLRMPEGAAA